MVITNSPDISNLSVKVTWDISGRYPLIALENLSTGNNLANVKYAFKISSPSDTSIYDGNLGQPDIVGVWTSFTFYSTIPDPLLSPAPVNYIVAGWPRPFNQIEWSGAPYEIQILVTDSVSTVIEPLVITQSICRPSGNIPTSITTYGKGNVTIQNNCNAGNSYFEDITNTSYKGLSGTLESSQLKVLYPDDETDAAPSPFVINNFSTALVPITYDSDNYEFVYSAIYLYDFGNNSFVRIKYYLKDRFSVYCNIDLCPLVCEYEKLLQKAASGQCGDQAETTKLLLQINGKMNLAMVAKIQPLCGINLPKLIEEIKVLGNFQCDCCSPSGIKPFNSANLGDYNFQIIPGGGDINGSVNVVGNNIQFTLYDKNYIFKICDTAPTSAFTVTPSTSGYTRTFCLNVDMTIFATDLLNTVKGNQSLVNLFNSIVDTGSSNFTLIVDGGCIFQTTSSCDYVYGLNSIPASSTYALLTTIKVHNVVKSVNYAFNLTNLAGLQTYLSALGYGSFVVANLTGGDISITASGNTFDLSDLTYKVAGANQIANFSKECTGFLPISANQVVQDIINYLCGITDAEVITSQAYDICYINPTTKLKATVTMSAGVEMNTFLAELLDRGCDNVNYILSLSAVNCASVVNLFPQAIDSMQANDYVLGQKEGACARIFPVELGTSILELGSYDQTFIDAFCKLVQICGGGNLCEPYSVMNVTVAFSSPSDDEMDITIGFDHPSAISHILQYARVDNIAAPVYTTVPGILPGATPYTISGLDEGQYVAKMTPVYADGRSCFPTTRTTVACFGISAFNAVFSTARDFIYVNYVASSSSVKVKVELPNGGFYETLVANTGAQIDIPISGDGGTYTVYMIPYCNTTTNWYGNQTAPAILNITCNAPANLTSSAVTSTSFTETWSAVAGATGYEYRLNGGVWVDNGTALTVTLSGLSINTLYVFEVRAVIGSVQCTSTSTNSVTTSYNYTLSASYAMSIDSVSGTNAPSLPPTGINGTQTGAQTGLTGNYTFVLSGATIPGTVMYAYVNGVPVDTVDISAGPGSYVLTINAGSTDDVRISIVGS